MELISENSPANPVGKLKLPGTTEVDPPVRSLSQDTKTPVPSFICTIVNFEAGRSVFLTEPFATSIFDERRLIEDPLRALAADLSLENELDLNTC